MTWGLSDSQLFSLTDSNAKINIWEGAVRSGKTYVSLWRWLKELVQCEDLSSEFVMVARTYDSFKRNVLPLLINFIKSDAKYFIGKRELYIYNRKINIVGADDDRAETKIRGATFQGAYVDELTIIPESFFKMLISRTAMKNAKIFATTNPDSPYHWVKKDFLEKNPDVKSYKFNLNDNPNLTDEEKNYLKRQYRGIWKDRFIDGKWVCAQGSIYDFFDVSTHVIAIAPSQAKYYVVGVDYGTTNPAAFVLVGVNENVYPNYWVEDLYYWDSKKRQRQKTDSEYADDLKSFTKNRNVHAIYIDPSAASFRLECLRNGIENIFEADNDVLNGIRMVGKYISNGTLKICANCQNLIEEIQGYVWDEKSQKIGIDKPLKANDHAVDALRYVVTTHFGKTPMQRLSAEQIDENFYSTHGPIIPSIFQSPY